MSWKLFLVCYSPALVFLSQARSDVGRLDNDGQIDKLQHFGEDAHTAEEGPEHLFNTGRAQIQRTFSPQNMTATKHPSTSDIPHSSPNMLGSLVNTVPGWLDGSSSSIDQDFLPEPQEPDAKCFCCQLLMPRALGE